MRALYKGLQAAVIAIKKSKNAQSVARAKKVRIKLDVMFEWPKGKTGRYFMPESAYMSKISYSGKGRAFKLNIFADYEKSTPEDRKILLRFLTKIIDKTGLIWTKSVKRSNFEFSADISDEKEKRFTLRIRSAGPIPDFVAFNPAKIGHYGIYVVPKVWRGNSDISENKTDRLIFYVGSDVFRNFFKEACNMKKKYDATKNAGLLKDIDFENYSVMKFLRETIMKHPDYSKVCAAAKVNASLKLFEEEGVIA